MPFSTVATELLFELHVTFLFVASAGETVAVNSALAPLTKGNSVCERVTPVTGTITVTSHLSISSPWLPLAATVAVIVAVPPLIPFILIEEATSTICTIVGSLLAIVTVSLLSIPSFVSSSICSTPLISEIFFVPKVKARSISPLIVQCLLRINVLRAVVASRKYFDPSAPSCRSLCMSSCAAQPIKLLL